MAIQQADKLLKKHKDLHCAKVGDWGTILSHTVGTSLRGHTCAHSTIPLRVQQLALWRGWTHVAAAAAFKGDQSCDLMAFFEKSTLLSSTPQIILSFKFVGGFLKCFLDSWYRLRGRQTYTTREQLVEIVKHSEPDVPLRWWRPETNKGEGTLDWHSSGHRKT